MPQMAPMNWILMSSSFIIILLMILCLIHSFYLIDKSEDLPNIIKEQIKWKW
uniref:ATP synthase F0 subunit 8 n=1 Tax=Thereuonema tuberculata TaxID=353554 RepID=UPI0022FD4446|nr:ATP synthase F0 subunit 8 [Thereuonema tuberculata]WAX37246.1 ATP synthase subunit 8 [Thereuonema tuberculata]